MGLDLIVEGRPKPGLETEWRALLERAFANEPLSDADEVRFKEIIIPAYEGLGAPRVGADAAADAWILEQRKATTPEERAAVLEAFAGYHVLALVTSDGLPRYTHANLYAGVDETSFRGSALKACTDVLPKALIAAAWEHRFPEDAVAYGKALLSAVDAARTAGPPAARKPGLLARLGLGRARVEAPFEEQLDIAQTAGRWFVFWGERSHAIRAWA